LIPRPIAAILVLMTGIQYITDDKGKRISVVINLRKHQALWEDFYDAWVADDRKDGDHEPWDEVKKELRRSRRKVAK